MPVLPDVDSTMVLRPGSMRPSASGIASVPVEFGLGEVVSGGEG
jgi:hypothetical protein